MLMSSFEQVPSEKAGRKLEEETSRHNFKTADVN
jgi:hypothetical protein